MAAIDGNSTIAGHEMAASNLERTVATHSDWQVTPLAPVGLLTQSKDSAMNATVMKAANITSVLS